MAANREYIQGTVYREVGGAREVVSSGASLDVESGGELDIESGGALKLAGTDITVNLATATVPASGVETVAATNVITAAEHGKTFFLSHATEFASTLPAAAAGLKFSFIVADAPESANYTIVTDSSANVILGQIYTVDVDSATNPEFVTAGVDTITIVAAKAVVGDRVDVICDGTNWFAYCFCSVFDAITFDTAS